MTRRQRKKQRKHILLAKSFDKRGRLIAAATNSYTKTHPLQLHFAKQVGMPEYDKLHAEILCLLRSRERDIHTLTIERYSADGMPALARPCNICMCAIRTFNVKFIQYTTSNGFVTERI